MRACFVMGDQLSLSLDSLKSIDRKTDIVLMFEVQVEANYVGHHKKKLVLIFSAMRHFAKELLTLGYKVEYVKLRDSENTGSFASELQRFHEKYNFEKIYLTEPSEHRVLEMLSSLALPLELFEDNRFLASHKDFADWAKSRQQLRMEYFYREMRKKHNILMDKGKPEQGKWNFDSENRKFPKHKLEVPSTTSFVPDEITKAVIEMVQSEFDDNFGSLDNFTMAVKRSDALLVLSDFLEYRLAHFGDYQDAMIEGEPWMFHSHISFYLNIGLLSPLECIIAAEKKYQLGEVSINSVEGFIRQILGWREYIRGIYWLKMPKYKEENFLAASLSLPDFYWSGETDMNCLKQSISETKNNAYAHHIQRLMVLGNFALIYGVKPSDLNNWFLSVYADAFEWVELPNVSGMVLYADGGFLASKPYAAGGSYINKMSNYCKSCVFSVKEKTGDDACPFNYLYWDFLMNNKYKFGNNPRMAMIYRVLEKMQPEQKNAITSSSKKFREKLNEKK